MDVPGDEIQGEPEVLYSLQRSAPKEHLSGSGNLVFCQKAL